jgi:hypothetical protein
MQIQAMGLIKIYIPGILCILTIWFISCENQNEEDLFGKTDCDTNQISYSGYIEPLIENHCYRCHAGADLIAPFSLEGYDNVKIRVMTGQLYGALNHKDGYQNMPRGRPKLPDCDLSKINSWIREGAQNN